MKNVLMMLFLMALTAGCSKDEPVDNTPKEIEMSFYAYKKIEPGSPSFKASAKFFLFDASNGQQFREERIEIPSGDYNDYSSKNSEMITLLKNNEYELKDGTRVKPIVVNMKYNGEYFISIVPSYKNPDEWDSLISHNKVKIPYGKYYIVALLRESGWAYEGKYSGKYIEVKENMPISDQKIEITFPHDGKHKGFIDWVTANW